MPRFINTGKTIAEIQDLIVNAGENLILLAPFLKLSPVVRELLAYRNGKNKITTLVFSRQELNTDEVKFLENLRFVILKRNESVHAKCYVNDDKMILTSLNLHECSSGTQSQDMGFVLDRNDPVDAALYEDSFKEVNKITATSEYYRFQQARPEIPSPGSGYRKMNNAIGFCVRTGAEIPFNIDKPLSYEGYRTWSRQEDPNAPENYCHFSGDPSYGLTSVNKPILDKYLEKARREFGV